MILLDTHVWIWWVHGDKSLSKAELLQIDQSARSTGIAISAISCWEVAKLAEKRRLTLPMGINDWMQLALTSNVAVLPITPAIAIKSTQLGSSFHRDPADQMITATSLDYGLPLYTADHKILAYAPVKTVKVGP